MKTKEMDKLIKHFDTYFEQDDSTVLHPIVDDGLHIDVLMYAPNEKYPFWKLVTMGASDYKMPPIQNTVGLNNEYIMFIDSEIDLTDKEVLNKFNKFKIMFEYISLDQEYISNLELDHKYYNAEVPIYGLTYKLLSDDKNINEIKEIYPEFKVEEVKLEFEGDGYPSATRC